LADALAAAEAREARLLDDATRWRRAVSACLPGQTPETAVECVSHLAFIDAEREIARLREALQACVYAHERLLPAQVAYDDARAALMEPCTPQADAEP
jgi:hypothetical protein